jgi:hypothetical protein
MASTMKSNCVSLASWRDQDSNPKSIASAKALKTAKIELNDAQSNFSQDLVVKES